MRSFRVPLAILAASLAAVALASASAQAQGAASAPTLTVTVEPASLDLKPGEIANVTLLISNPTSRSLALELGAQALNATPMINFSLSVKTLSLAPNASQRVLVGVKAQPRAVLGEQSLLLGAHEMASPTASASAAPLANATTRLVVHILGPAPTTTKPKPNLTTPSAPSAPPPASAESAALVATPSVMPGGSQVALVVAGGAAAVGGGAWTLSWIRRRGGWLALVAPLYTRLAPHRILDQPTRRRVADLVLAEPGITFGDAQRKLGIGAGALTHHARMLEQAGILFSSPDGQTRRLFPVGGGFVAPVPSLAERALAELRGGPATLSSLADRLGVSRQSLHYHVKRLISQGKLRAEGDTLRVA